ncbi:transcriptional regulatory protein YycF [mine drainage metagenome]|uniref:Transcriptional regulatory protein YycF n=1 Tax=mine drainage metagenome TaxID=410659 RepID=A0A1J5QA82_9ZZZZ
MSSPLLLLIDDDEQLMRRLRAHLARLGYRVCVAHRVAAIDAALGGDVPDLVVLDWNLPERDGLTHLVKWRAGGALTPVLMLSGNVSANHRVAGLRGGADDYLTKPFDIDELVARIEALLRRSAPALQPPAPVLRFGPFVLDLGAARLSRAGEVLALASAELELLMIFGKHANRVLARERLLELTGDLDGERLDRSVDLRVARLRERLGDDARAPRWIITVRGQGYRFDAQISADEASRRV